jgi:hypothetical protein
MIPVITHFIPDDQEDQQAGGNTYCQSGNIQEGKRPFPPQRAVSNLKMVVVKHGCSNR